MPVFSPTEALDPHQWRDLFDKRSLARATEYLRLISRFELEEDADSFTLSGRIQGTASKPYVTRVTVTPITHRLYEYECGCSCPVGVNCKHAAALLMLASRQQATAASPSERIGHTQHTPHMLRTSQPEWQAWLGTLAPATSVVPLGNLAQTRPQTGPPRQFAVLLDAVDNAVPARIAAKLVWVQKTRQGRWGKLESIRLEGLGNDLDAGLIDETWQDRLARLQLRSAQWHPRHKDLRPLHGARGEALLLDLLQSGVPCFWQKPANGELRIGPERSLQWHWHTDDAGVQRLRTDEGLLLQVEGFWRLDPSSLTLQRLATDLEPAQVAALLRMPPLPPDQTLDFVAHARQHPLLAAVPAPDVIEATPPVEAVPTPIARLLHLPLTRSAWGRDPHTHVPCVRLEYDYAGHRVPGPPARGNVRRIDNGKLLEIRRSLRHESAAEEVLAKADFRPMQVQHGLHHRVAGADTRLDYVAGMPGAPVYDPAELMQQAAALARHGFRIETDPSFPFALTGEPDGWYANIGDSASGEAWFDAELGIELDGERISLLPILKRALGDRRLNLAAAPPNEPADAVWYVPLPDGRMVTLPLAKLRSLVAPLLQWMSGGTGGGPLRLPRVAAGLLKDLSQVAHLELRGKTASALRTLADELRGAKPRRPVAVPRTLKTTLRSYQRDGLTWLDFLARTGLGGVLADDMGLGKTVQILAHLLKEREAGRLDAPALVVCPTSVVGNWHEQAARFAPVLRVRIIHGSERHAHFQSLDDCDLAITTYALLPRDRETLTLQHFSLAIFDEAQALKNAGSQAAQVARALPARRKLAVTGTPLENHLGELWSQFECVLPGLLGDSTSFTRHFRTPIEKHGDQQRQQQLNRRIAGFVLRRTKAQVAQDLPAKTEMVQTLELTGKQRALYETLRLSMHEKVKQAVEKRGLAQSSIIILDALLKLRQACCDPRLIQLDAARKVKESAKLDALLEMVDELLSEGRKILLFSQFTGMLDLIEDALRPRGIAWLRLDGSSRNRTQIVERFQSGEARLFLISLKAGGVGLNLTAADTVIHYDPWWNPAVEAQATDRAHRIGQTQPVFVYKLICAGTVEEKILALQQRKGDLARAVLEGGSRAKLAFDEADIEALFAPI